MFQKGDQCVTVRTGEEVPEEQQRLIWDILESFVNSRKPDEVDDQQIFELKVANIHGYLMQRVTHRQENHPFIEMAVFEVEQPVEATIYVNLEKEATPVRPSAEDKTGKEEG